MEFTNFRLTKSGLCPVTFTVTSNPAEYEITGEIEVSNNWVQIQKYVNLLIEVNPLVKSIDFRLSKSGLCSVTFTVTSNPAEYEITGEIEMSNELAQNTCIS